MREASMFPGTSSSNRGRIFIVDTTIILYGNINRLSMHEKVISTGAILEEIRSKFPRFRLQILKENPNFSTLQPDHQSLEHAKVIAEKTGTRGLSRADCSIIAIAFQLKERGYKPMVLTDDYAIQNVLKSAGLPYKPFTTSGIKKTIKWMYSCKACGASFKKPPGDRECPECGTTGLIRRKPKVR